MSGPTFAVLLQWRARRPITRAQLDAVAAALNTQVTHLRERWPDVRHAEVTADPVKAHAHAAPPWPMVVMDHSSAGLGVHLDTHGHPYAEVSATSDWSVTASHELLEMLIDPYGRKFKTGPSVDPTDDGQIVRYLVEVGDPVEAISYEIDGVRVSDFVTPDWYDVHAAGPWSYTGSADRALHVLDGGYVSWIGPDGHWHQLLPDGTFNRSQRPAAEGGGRDDRDDALGADADGDG